LIDPDGLVNVAKFSRKNPTKSSIDIIRPAVVIYSKEMLNNPMIKKEKKMTQKSEIPLERRRWMMSGLVRLRLLLEMKQQKNRVSAHVTWNMDNNAQ
jgi:hypothetical protein